MSSARSPVAVTPSRRALWIATLVSLACVLLWDASGLDPALASLAATPRGFPWKDAPLARALHEAGRVASFAALLWLATGILRPWGILARLDRRSRVRLLAVTIAAMLLIPLLKHFSATSCPWDLREFGGAAAFVPHWNWRLNDGGPGHCFPAGHASAAFAFVSGFFAFRRVSPKTARRWLAAALAAGALFGAIQQLRGAHYLSHTLWTAWLCWAVAFAADSARRPRTA